MSELRGTLAGVSSESLPRSPRNAAQVPLEREMRKWPGSHDALVIARLEWPRGAELRPARVVQSTRSLVLVEWQSGRTVRRTWLQRSDVAVALPTAL